VGLRGVNALAHVPGFVIWRLLGVFAHKTKEWVRTGREKP